MVRLRGRSSRARGARRGVGGRGGGGRGGANRGAVRGTRGGRGGRGASFAAPLMGRPRPPALQPMGFGEPDYGYPGPRMPPMMPPPMSGPRALRPYPPVPHLGAPYPRARPFPSDYPVMHPMGMPPVPPRPMLPPIPHVPPFIRGRGGFRGGLSKTGKAFNNGMLNKGKANKKKSAKAKRNEENDPFYCEACNRSWKTAEALQEHISEHEVCGREGCTFTAHPKIVALHVQFHHYTGVYEKIANVQSPEEISKWIAERKSRYPTNANIALRVAKEKEMIERGERVEENNVNKNNRRSRGEQKSNKTNWRERRLQRNQANTENKPLQKRNEVISDDEDKDEDPKKEWNGNLPPFQGLPCLSALNATGSDLKIKENLDNSDSSTHNISLVDCDPTEGSQSSSALTNSDDSACNINLTNDDQKVDIQLSSASINCSDVAEGENSLIDVSYKEIESKSASEVEFNMDSSINLVDTNVNSNHYSSSNDAETNQSVSGEAAVGPSNSDPLSEEKLKLVPYDVEENEESGDSGPEESPFVRTSEKSVVLPTESSLETSSESTKAACDSLTTSNSSEINESVNNNLSKTDEFVKNSKSRKRQRHRGSSDKDKDSGKDFVKKENILRNKKLTLLEKLLSKEIRHERNVILQCAHYVVSNNFFDDEKNSDIWIDDSDSDSDCSFD